MTTKIEKLEAEKAELEAKQERLAKRADKLREEYRQMERDEERIENRLRAERLKELIGKPVRVGRRVASTEPDAWMNDAVGTLVKVNRTLCVVDYGDVGKEHGCQKWRIPIYDIKAADEPQATTLGALQAGEAHDEFWQSSPNA